MAHRPLLVLRAEQITGDRGTAEDVVQDTCTYLLKHIHRYNPIEATALTWVLGAVTRRAFNAMRNTNRLIYTGDAPDSQRTVPPDGQIEEEARQLLAYEMFEYVRKHDPKYLEAALALGNGATLTAIGVIDGVTIGAVKKRLGHALKRWRKLLSEKYTQAQIDTVLGR